MAEQLLFKQIGGLRWAAFAGDHDYIVLQSGGLWQARELFHRAVDELDDAFAKGLSNVG